MQTAVELTPREKIQTAAAGLKLAIESVFVPCSRSRNSGEKRPSLNWRVTLLRDGRKVLQTDYMAGYGHCPAYKRPPAGGSALAHAAVEWECENGRRAARGVYVGRDREHEYQFTCGERIAPDVCDVLHSLALDAGVLDAGGFEERAACFGYDTDSKKAESIYQACMDIAVKLRAGLGEDGLRRLIRRPFYFFKRLALSCKKYRFASGQ